MKTDNSVNSRLARLENTIRKQQAEINRLNDVAEESINVFKQVISAVEEIAAVVENG